MLLAADLLPILIYLFNIVGFPSLPPSLLLLSDVPFLISPLSSLPFFILVFLKDAAVDPNISWCLAVKYIFFNQCISSFSKVVFVSFENWKSKISVY